MRMRQIPRDLLATQTVRVAIVTGGMGKGERRSLARPGGVAARLVRLRRDWGAAPALRDLYNTRVLCRLSPRAPGGAAAARRPACPHLIPADYSPNPVPR